MIKVDQYQLIRKLYAVEGLSQREIVFSHDNCPGFAQGV